MSVSAIQSLKKIECVLKLLTMLILKFRHLTKFFYYACPRIALLWRTESKAAMSSYKWPTSSVSKGIGFPFTGIQNERPPHRVDDAREAAGRSSRNQSVSWEHQSLRWCSRIALQKTVSAYHRTRFINIRHYPKVGKSCAIFSLWLWKRKSSIVS